MQGEQINMFNPHTVKAGEISDGYHTFDELYEHRTALFATICNMLPKLSWKSFKHDDGTMYDNCFIAGIHTPEGDYSYHCLNKYFYMFALTPEVEKAPPFDGHKPCDYDRLFGLCLTNSLYTITPQEMVKVCKPKKEHHVETVSNLDFITALAREQAKAHGIDLTKADEFYGRKD